MFEYDICLCGNPQYCPKKDTCLRNQGRVGINTYSLFFELGKDCQHYIPKKEKENESNVK